METGEIPDHIVVVIEHPISQQLSSVGIREVSGETGREIDKPIRTPLFAEDTDFSQVKQDAARSSNRRS